MEPTAFDREMSMSKDDHSLARKEKERRAQFVELLRATSEPVSEAQALEDFEVLSARETSAMWDRLQRQLQDELPVAETAPMEPFSWSSWFGEWFLPLAAAPALAVLILLFVPVSQPHDSGGAGHYTGTKSASKGAYLEIQTLKSSDLRAGARQDMSRALPLVPGRSYTQGDAFLFRFLLTRAGYVTLLREGKGGTLERLYPFPKQSPRRFAAGQRVNLAYKGQRMLYVLDSSLVGTQRFLLVYTESPRVFSTRRSDLTTSERRLLETADRLTVEVRPRR